MTHSAYVNQLKAVPDIFDEISQRFSDRVALIFDQRQITYRELAEQCSALAAVLQNNCLIKGDIVAIKIERSPELYIFMLALMKIGAVMVPVNSNSPERYIGEVLSAAGARYLISDDVTSVPGGSWQVLSSRTLIQNCAQQRSGNYPVLSADDPALILMTSGSTGKPKSVLIAHRGIARLSLPVPALGNSERDCYLQIADVSFAASANEIWMALLTGACLTIAPPGLPDLMALVRQIESDNVTMLFLSGGLFRLFVEVSLETLHIPDCVVVSGDFVNPRLFSVAAQAGKAKIFNGLGCTENSAISSLYHIQSEGQLSSDSPVPVGTALPLVEMVVFNERLQPCTCGEYGELFIAGAGVALGYSDPQLTAERFISDDRATCDQDSNIVLVGRGNHICKIRGFRVNLAGIEHLLRLHHAVEDVLIVVEETPDEPRLHACYVTQDDALSVADLKNHLAMHAPAWMIPEKFSRLAVLPMTANGKKDRLRLKNILLEQV